MNLRTCLFLQACAGSLLLPSFVAAHTAAAADFVQVDPANGSPVTEQTEVHIAYNSHSLFMGVTGLDSEPEKWIG